MAASDVSLATGCDVIKALSPNRCIDVHLSGNTLRRRILPRYWTVVQHRARICAITIGRVVFAAERETGLALRANVALLILLTECYQVGTCGSPLRRLLEGTKAVEGGHLDRKVRHANGSVNAVPSEIAMQARAQNLGKTSPLILLKKCFRVKRQLSQEACYDCIWRSEVALGELFVNLYCCVLQWRPFPE